MAVLDGLKVIDIFAILASLFDDTRYGLVVEVHLLAAEDVCVPSLLAFQENLSILFGALHVLDNDTGVDALFKNIQNPVDRLAGRQIGLTLDVRRANLVLLNLVEDGLAVSSIFIVATLNPATNGHSNRVDKLERTSTRRANAAHV